MSDTYVLGLLDNLWKLNLQFAIRGALIHIGVLTLFFMEHGVDLQGVFVIHAFFSITKVALEIPSGYVSDRWGRQRTIALGTFIKFCGMLCYCLGSSFWAFMVAVFGMAVGSSFLSGTLEAMTYDTLLELKREKEYREIAGRQAFIQFGTEAIGSLFGGLLALISLRAPIWVTMIIFGIAPIVALSMQEPKRHKEQGTVHWQTIKNICHETFVTNVPLRSIITLYSVTIALTMSLFWFQQPYQEWVGLPLIWFGVVHAVIVAAHAFASRYLHKFHHHLDDRYLLMAIGSLVIVSYLGLSVFMSLGAIAFFILARAMWGIITPLTHDLINRMVSSEKRATVLSLGSFGWNILFAIASPFLGYAADIYGLSQALLIAGIVGGITMVVVFWQMRGVWGDIPQ